MEEMRPGAVSTSIFSLDLFPRQMWKAWGDLNEDYEKNTQKVIDFKFSTVSLRGHVL